MSALRTAAIEEVARWIGKSGYLRHVTDPDRLWARALADAEGLMFGDYGEPSDANKALAAYALRARHYHTARCLRPDTRPAACDKADLDAILEGARHPEASYTEVRSSACHAGSDGDCSWSGCPQLRDGEPATSGRHCPLDSIARHPEAGETNALLASLLGAWRRTKDYLADRLATSGRSDVNINAVLRVMNSAFDDTAASPGARHDVPGLDE